MWNRPGSGIKPMFSALAGRFLTAGPSGSPHFSFKMLLIYIHYKLEERRYHGPLVTERKWVIGHESTHVIELLGPGSSSC